MVSRTLLLMALLSAPLFADEGVWLFDRFPHDAVKQKYGFEVTPEFLDNLRLASVRIGGASGSFVSRDGLLLTNQHVVAACLGTHLTDGFYATSPSAELKCSDLDVNVLTGMEDITQQFPAAKKGVTTKEIQQRESEIKRIETECSSHPAESCQVVNLFSGSRFSLYRYKRYTDVRLVFAPEQELAFFGRERDSITYLRYGLDIAFVRAYESGKAASTPHFLKWSSAGAKDGELVIAAGNPRATVRETTAAQLTFYRDTVLPLQLARLGKRIGAFKNPADPQRILLLGTYKSAAGKLIGLRDDRLVTRKTLFDAKIRRAVEADPKLGTDAGKVWDQVANAYKTWAPNEKAYQILEEEPAPGSSLFHIARALVRAQPVEGEFSIDEPLEINFLTQYLEELKSLGAHDKDVPVKAILAGRTPQAAAEAFVHASNLRNAGQRRRLAMNHDALPDSEDGMIQLAELLEPSSQRIRKKHQEILTSVGASAAAQIAQYRFRLFGDAEYPDATATPRVEFGVLKSYTDRAGINEPYAATFSGLYYRRTNNGPYQVPQRWIDAKPFLNAVTELDFVSTCDIGGGDAGNATVNRTGELVGVIFDGNLESLPNTYLYTEDQARAVHVSADGIAEALEKVYKADSLMKELGLPKTSEILP